MDRIDAMRAFVAVVNEGTFTRAAERLELSPQLVSKYISRLEQHLGIRLFNRTTRSVHLTEAGTRYHVRAVQLLNDLDDMENELDDMHADAKGVLRISAPVSFAVRHLGPALSDFQKTHPAVSIDLQLNDRKVDLLDEGFDIALRVGHLKSSSLVAKKIAPVRLIMCASPDYLAQHGVPEKPEDLLEHCYLRYSYMDQEVIPEVLKPVLQRGSAMEGGMVSNNGDVLVEAAMAGAGITLQPSFISGSAILNGQLHVILSAYEPEPMGLYAVYAHRQLLASKVRSFVDFMDGYFGNPPYWDRFD